MNINVLENQEICAVYFAKSMKYAKILFLTSLLYETHLLLGVIQNMSKKKSM